MCKSYVKGVKKKLRYNLRYGEIQKSYLIFIDNF